MEAQNRRLVSLDEAKDDFLRGVSHNLQTPLASIRGYAQQLEAERPDRRLDIITEQVDRLSRMVRQLLTVSRIESGALRSRLEVFAPVPRVRRTWEALGAADVPFTLEDRSEGWLALGDPDQLDQVLWALLDNAVGYGGRTPIDATVTLDPATEDLLITIADHGPGVPDEDRERLFGRFERGAGRPIGRGLRAGPLRLPGAVPRDGRRPGARAGARRAGVPRSRSSSRPRPPRRPRCAGSPDPPSASIDRAAVGSRLSGSPCRTGRRARSPRRR